LVVFGVHEAAESPVALALGDRDFPPFAIVLVTWVLGPVLTRHEVPLLRWWWWLLHCSTPPSWSVTLTVTPPACRIVVLSWFRREATDELEVVDAGWVLGGQVILGPYLSDGLLGCLLALLCLCLLINERN
jgi:hypothetical protein